MRARSSSELLPVVAARVVDLRAEFEAQLRAVARVEQLIRKVDIANDERARPLRDMLQRDLKEMLGNNRNIRIVLEELVNDLGNGTAKFRSEVLRP